MLMRFGIVVTIFLLVFAAGCGNPDPVSAQRYAEPDRLFATLDDNVAASEYLEKVVGIDHSRLGAEAGSFMPPAQLLIFSDPALDAKLIARNQLSAIDLPLRILAYE